LDDRGGDSGGLRSARIEDGALFLVLNNCLAAVEDGQGEVGRFLDSRALDKRIRHRIEVLFEELVANTIRHGFAEGSGQSIHVRVTQTPEAVRLTFEDDGLPFNPLEAPPPQPFTSLAEARIGGLGISLVVRLSSELRYERLDLPAEAAGFAPRNRTMVRVDA
jgi:anti-sigma regulatory factor (Ser/Thr protein kinase)